MLQGPGKLRRWFIGPACVPTFGRYGPVIRYLNCPFRRFSSRTIILLRVLLRVPLKGCPPKLAIMDPLSFTANLIAIAGAASMASEGFRRLLSLKHVPQEVLQFVNEISDFRAVIAVVEETMRQLDDIGNGKEAINIANQMTETLRRATESLTELNDIIRTKIILNYSLLTTQPVRVSRTQWLKRSTYIRSLLENVRKERQNLSASLIVLQASELPRVRATLTGIIHHNKDLSTSLQRLENQAMSRISDMEPSLELIRSTLQRIETSIPRNSEKGDANLSSRPNYEIRTSIYGPSKCNGLCMCRCHQRVAMKSPDWMRSILGQLFVGYHGMPLFSHRSCTERRCDQERTCLLNVAYFFPAWFLHRIIFTRNRWTPTHGLMISVRTPRVVGGWVPVFLTSMSGNLMGLRYLFADGLASPFDTHSISGQTPLHVAIKNEQFLVCEFLLSQSADPEVSNSRSITPLDEVWNQILFAPDSETTRQFKRIFGELLDADELLLRRKFTILHQIVLKLSSIPLQAQLCHSTAGIDAKCSFGRTALEMALLLKEPDTLQTLLNFGAAIDTVDAELFTVFHMAAMYSSAECLKMLFASASMLPADGGPWNQAISQVPVPLMPNKTDPVSTINPRIKQFLQSRDKDGYDPLYCACFRDRTGENARFLLDIGADIDSRYFEGSKLKFEPNPLLIAVQYNNHAAILVLLSRHPNQNIKDKEQTGLLHILAAWGDRRTFEILLSSKNIRVLGTHDIDFRGHTPVDRFDKERHMYVTEDADTNSWCREALVSLVNWRDNNPMPEEVPSGDQNTDVASTNSERDVFYDFDQPIP